jgi:hypothetical protein
VVRVLISPCPLPPLLSCFSALAGEMDKNSDEWERWLRTSAWKPPRAGGEGVHGQREIKRKFRERHHSVPAPRPINTNALTNSASTSWALYTTRPVPVSEKMFLRRPPQTPIFVLPGTRPQRGGAVCHNKQGYWWRRVTLTLISMGQAGRSWASRGRRWTSTCRRWLFPGQRT